MEIVPLGDSALLVRVVDQFEAAPARALEAVLRVRDQLRAARIDAIADIAPSYTTVAVFFHPDRDVALDVVTAQIRTALAKSVRSPLAHARTIDVPVCYDHEFAPDLDEVAERAGISPEQVVRLHTRASYQVSCVGFSPGFPYLSGLPREIATPRRAAPRTRVPAGSVAIGGRQTGIYPHESPGGWNIVGRTSLCLFDAAKNPPALLRAGDKVRFRAITRDEFLSMR